MRRTNLSLRTPGSTTFPADGAFRMISEAHHLAGRLLRRTARASSSLAARRTDTGAGRFCLPPPRLRSPALLGPPAPRCTLTDPSLPPSITLWTDIPNSSHRLFPAPLTAIRKHWRSSEEKKDPNLNYESVTEIIKISGNFNRDYADLENFTSFLKRCWEMLIRHQLYF